MPAGSFVDTNIWVYAHLQAPGEPRHPRALAFARQLQNGVISPQVVAEYYSVMLRNGKDDTWIQTNLAAIFSYTQLQPLNASVVQRTLSIRNRYGFSYWDCQIVAAALEAGCVTLCTEDLQAGQIIDNVLAVVNPLHS